MPPTSWILLCIITGSAAGATGDAAGIVFAATIGLAVARRVRRHGRLAIVAALALSAASALRAAADRWRDAHCRAELVRAGTIEFVTDFDLRVGDAGPAQMRPTDARCNTKGVIRARAAVVGGQWYRTTSRAAPVGRSVIVTVTSARATGERQWRPALRAAGVRRVDSIFVRDAPMARALLLADMHLIAPEIRERWSRAGLVHLLSVSGVHVAIVAAALLLLATAMRLSSRAATLVALVATAAYVVILGLPPPAVRAGVMFGCVLIAKLRQRPSSEWSVLMLGALLPVLVDSAAPLDLGWQLSVLGVAALAATGALVRKLGWSGDGWWRGLRREALACVVASVASAPIVAWYFGTVSLVAPVTNLLAAPLVAVLQPTLFLALAAAPSLPVARFIAGAAHPVLALLDGVATVGARPTWAALQLAPTLLQCVIVGVAVGGLLTAMIQRRVAPPLFVTALSLMVLAWHDLFAWRGSGVLELHLLDVGQGDAVALRTPHGHWIVVDAGGGPPGLDRGRRTVLPYLRRLGGPVDAFILSHPHLDHVGGAPALIGGTRPRWYFDAAFAGATDAYRASLESAAVRGVRWQRVHPRDTVRVDGVLLRFLAPDSAWTARLTDANLASTIVRVEYGRVAMLLTGDAEREEEEWLLRETPAELLRADVLKVGHHGSRTSSTPSFLDAVQPTIALISVGRGNSYGHPSPEVLQSLAARQISIVRTDVAGTAVVRTDGYSLSVTTAAHQWTLPSTAASPRSGLPSPVR